MEISAIIAGERLVSVQLDELAGEMRTAVREKIAELTLRLEARVRVLTPFKSGELRSSIHSQVRESNQSQRIAGIVSGTEAYLPVIEFGIHKQIAVRGHEQILDHAWDTDIEPESVYVSPYTRMAEVQGKLFMQRALESMEPEIVAELRAVIDTVSAAHSDV